MPDASLKGCACNQNTCGHDFSGAPNTPSKHLHTLNGRSSLKSQLFNVKVVQSCWMFQCIFVISKTVHSSLLEIYMQIPRDSIGKFRSFKMQKLSSTFSSRLSSYYKPRLRHQGMYPIRSLIIVSMLESVAADSALISSSIQSQPCWLLIENLRSLQKITRRKITSVLSLNTISLVLVVTVWVIDVIPEWHTHSVSFPR